MAAVGRRVVIASAQDAIRTEGASNGQPWPQHRPLTVASLGVHGQLRRSGMLRNSFDAKLNVESQTRVTLAFFAGVMVGEYNLGAIHQFGVKKDIVPVKAKALFIPLRRAKGTIGGQFRAHRSKLFLLDGKRVRASRAETKGGRIGEILDLERGKDFVLLPAIRATAEKGGYAIPPRPFFVVTDATREAIVNEIKTLYLTRLRGMNHG